MKSLTNHIDLFEEFQVGWEEKVGRDLGFVCYPKVSALQDPITLKNPKA